MADERGGVAVLGRDLDLLVDHGMVSLCLTGALMFYRSLCGALRIWLAERARHDCKEIPP
jgi:hypothetical protein